MQDVAPALLEALQKAFARHMGDTALQGMTYEAAGDYAEAVGQALADAFAEVLHGDALPDGRMYWNIADRVVRPLLEEDHRLAAAAAETVQNELNRAAGLGLKAQTVPPDTDRIKGILDRISAAERYDDVSWVLDEPVVNFSRHAVDETLQQNVAFQGGAGLTPKVIRRAVGGCCDWCTALAGTYRYPDVPKDVYRRHANCRCIVEYDPGSGKRQNVHTKAWREEPEEKKRIQAIQSLSTNGKTSATIEERNHLGRKAVPLDNDRYSIAEDKIKKFLLKPGAKHAEDFFRVGYSTEDAEILNADLYAGFDLKRKTDERSFSNGRKSFSIFMELGINQKRTFRTVWLQEAESDRPRFITAHRENPE